MELLHDVPFPTYQDMPGINASTLKAVADNPEHYRWLQDNPQPPKPEWTFGRAVHAIILEDGAGVVRLDVENYRSGDARKQRDDALEAGLTPLTISEAAHADAMHAAVMRHDGARTSLEGTSREVTFTGTDPGEFLRVKGRFDALHTDKRTIIDLKTTRSADPRTFGTEAARFGYHIQAAHYLAGMAAITDTKSSDWSFLFILVEKEPPFSVSVCSLDDMTLSLGFTARANTIRRYQRCTNTGDWSAYGNHVHTISAPLWAFDREENLGN